MQVWTGGLGLQPSFCPLVLLASRARKELRPASAPHQYNAENTFSRITEEMKQATYFKSIFVYYKNTVPTQVTLIILDITIRQGSFSQILFSIFVGVSFSFSKGLCINQAFNKFLLSG